MPFIPNTDADRKAMLERIGVQNFEQLISNIPGEIRFKGELNLPEPLSEMEVEREIRHKTCCNQGISDAISFLGGGAYDHFIPAAINHIASRSEFYTAYTPYQPEVSQGTLQVIYEYQSMIAELMNMEVANASMYDGGSALAEAVLMAVAETNKTKVLVSKAVHPHYRQVIRTYCHGQKIKINSVEIGEGVTSILDLKSKIDNETAAVVIQHPNFLGNLEHVYEISEIAHHNGALLITSNDPISLGLLEPPGKYDVDIATGEGQCLGNSLNFGGPYLGILTSKFKFVKRMPGRIAGATVDKNGKRGFVLTFQTREQHIRREKATSNICTNQALNALIATVYLALMGRQGIQDVATMCLQNSHYLAEQISKLGSFQIPFPSAFFKEFIVSTPVPPSEIINSLMLQNIYAGIDLAQFDYGFKNYLLVAVTEKRTKEEMDAFVETLKKFN
ncbi:MAG: aminomethyl-transferring glycine dehydrogenase subunit GcvPA [bacterium]|nr:aminomethyl-transferring glycine dehydrogenase subunit GcvPA [bacterium]